MKKHDESYYAFKDINDKPIILDFTGCRYLGEIHKILKERFGFPEYYGRNWSALWDCLRFLFGEEEPLSVEIHGFQTLPDDLKKYCAPMLEVFEDAHKDTPNITFHMIS